MFIEVAKGAGIAFAAHRDAIYLNPKLFARVKSLYDQRKTLGLKPDAEYMVERYYKDFVRAGAQLSEADKTKINDAIRAAESKTSGELYCVLAQNAGSYRLMLARSARNIGETIAVRLPARTLPGSWRPAPAPDGNRRG